MNNDVTELLCALDQGDPHAASQLLPLVYEELRGLPNNRISQLPLVHGVRHTISPLTEIYAEHS
jgi:hypothetical protein